MVDTSRSITVFLPNSTKVKEHTARIVQYVLLSVNVSGLLFCFSEPSCERVIGFEGDIEVKEKPYLFHLRGIKVYVEQY